MKSKLLLLDLSICSVWMLSLLGGRHGWYYPAFAFAMLGLLMRIVVSFSLYYREKRTWLPLCLFGILSGILISTRSLDLATIAGYFFYLTKLEYSSILKKTLGILLFLWLFVSPFIYVLFSIGKLKCSELTWKELLGAVLWHDRLTKTCSAILAIIAIAFLTGMSMEPHLCQVMCLSAVPLSYWLICRYEHVKADWIWLLVISMVIFWYAQITAGAWRASLLALSFMLIVIVGSRLYRNIHNHILVFCAVLYLGVLLPSFCIGYNQYACINYARAGYGYLSPFSGILYVKDSTGELLGLRDRYGLIIKPTYDNIRNGVYDFWNWSYEYPFEKDGYTRYYNVLNNEFVKEPDIQADLQHRVREILEGYFADYGSDYDDRGQIKITDLINGNNIADIRVSMYGLPSLNYHPERFISDDSVEVLPGKFFRNDSVAVYNDYIKQSLSYAINFPETTPRYRIYVRLAKDSIPSDSTLIDIASKVAALKELKP